MIRIKKLQDEHKNRIIELKTKNSVISGPTRCLNKREIKQFRYPNYAQWQENWNEGVLVHEIVEFSLDINQKFVDSLAKLQYFNNKISDINNNWDGYDHKFKLFIPRVKLDTIKSIDQKKGNNR